MKFVWHLAVPRVFRCSASNNRDPEVLLTLKCMGFAVSSQHLSRRNRNTFGYAIHNFPFRLNRPAETYHCKVSLSVTVHTDRQVASQVVLQQHVLFSIGIHVAHITMSSINGPCMVQPHCLNKSGHINRHNATRSTARFVTKALLIETEIVTSLLNETDTDHKFRLRSTATCLRPTK